MTKYQKGNGAAGSIFATEKSLERGCGSRKKTVRILLALLVFCAAVLSPVSLMAAQSSKKLVVEDGADLLTEEEKQLFFHTNAEKFYRFHDLPEMP